MCMCRAWPPTGEKQRVIVEETVLPQPPLCRHGVRVGLDHCWDCHGTEPAAEYLEPMRRDLCNALEAAGFKVHVRELRFADGWHKEESHRWHTLTIEVRRREPDELERKQRERDGS